MKKDIYKNTIKYLPMFFDSQLEFDPTGAGIFELLKKIIEFDEAYIFFLNPDSIQLKYIYSKASKYYIDQTFPIKNKLKQDLFSLSNEVFDLSHELIKLLENKENNSFLSAKLVIRNTVYGFILLCKYEKDYYNSEHIEISNTVAPVISYKIKDIELSEVFKIQLNALQEGFIQTKAAYKTIKEQNIKILEADEIKSEFLANISHELRTPLNAIIGFSESLSTKLFGDLNEKQLEYVNDIYISGIHLLGMINEILDLSKIEAKAMTLDKSHFPISMAVNEVVNIVAPLAFRKSISIKENIEQDKEITTDFQKIKQILYNLLSNAIKFTGEKGKVTVNIKFDKNNLIIETADTGIGIAPKDQKRIFDKFVQLETAYTKTESSTGLGLTITKELVEMLKGTIKLKSDVDKGSVFIVKIPMSKQN